VSGAAPIEEIQVRAAQNQALFREINERLRDLTVELEEDGVWTCECADITCITPIELTLAEYETIRAVPARFAVAGDDRHVVPEAERVVDRNDRYWVVEKIDVAGRLAVELDPRDT
jgi:hypothetical protein